MDAKITTKQGTGERILFKKETESGEIYFANIFPTHPYVTFTDKNGEMIEGTGYEFNTPEVTNKLDELREATINFIKERNRILIS